ncbi:GPALPP motifs-containing protein 1-like [Neocloeon triangulifer]|uniref:GPALPP motifs-containing protein 1-like n=1 Tax=Neocloeon triangulifer TaxID=2078957 RepID=UPI00286F5F36|nr:GPALPP motifs-containing protein 1-like [Neocloeon triangulifer]
MSRKVIGPALPPGYGAPKEEEEDAPIGPQIPSVGPSIPSGAKVGPDLPGRNSSSSDSDSEESFDGIELHDEEDLKSSSQYGPALPPGYGQKKVLGPTLPPGIIPGSKTEESDEDDSGIIGPAIPGSASDEAHWARIVEERAKRMKNKLTGSKDDKVVRETWMLELPKDRSGLLGLEARQFRKNPAPDRSADTSCWTDTPEEKLRKQKGEVKEKLDPKQELEQKIMAKRDKEMAKMAKAHKREHKSLMEIHEEKSKKSKGEGSGERQMFDRDRDLQVNRFDEAQKKAIVNKAKFLDDRFSTGGQKFL